MSSHYLGKKFYSEHFGATIICVGYLNDTNWYFTIANKPERGVLKAQTPFSEIVRLQQERVYGESSPANQ